MASPVGSPGSARGAKEAVRKFQVKLMQAGCLVEGLKVEGLLGGVIRVGAQTFQVLELND